MNDDVELEMLLDKIPQATSAFNIQEMLNNATNNHHHHTDLIDQGYSHASCVTQRMNSHSHSNSNVHIRGDGDESLKGSHAFAFSHMNGLPFGSSPFVEDVNAKSHLISGGGFCLDFKKVSESSLVDPFDLSLDLSNMCIREERDGMCDKRPNGSRNFERYGASDSYRNTVSYRVGPTRKPINFEREAGSGLVQMPYDQRMANLCGSWYSPSESCWSDQDPQFHRHNGLANNHFPMGFVVPSLDNPLVDNSLFYPHPLQGSKNLVEPSDPFCSSSMAYMVLNGKNKVPLSVRVPREGREDSLIIEGKCANYTVSRNAVQRGNNTKSFRHENYRFSRSSKFSSLAEAQGYIYHMAKDQLGCRFLQRMFDEGTSIDVQIIFNEIIDHAVELMMNPFGNYLMQKLLEVCNEGQRWHILFRVTEELVRISLNTHSTRVVQKLIETLKTKQQFSLVISALEPGFLALIKDLNGNHVIQRCLLCFPSEESRFIFVAVAKYCVEIATHQHGCCVLQRCISASTGKHQENLVAEISANGLLLAEDAYGNYVVQFILDLKIPSATSKLTSQFEGNYVHLSTQKFSSHVVEKCLSVCNEEARKKIIHELLSTPCFDQLLQDPHANYVIQKALLVCEGQLLDSLVNAIESHKAVSRNSPYSKKIFSQKLLKR